jgi:hypothetical protein
MKPDEKEKCILDHEEKNLYHLSSLSCCEVGFQLFFENTTGQPLKQTARHSPAKGRGNVAARWTGRLPSYGILPQYDFTKVPYLALRRVQMLP